MSTDQIMDCQDINKLRSWLDSSLKERDRLLRFMREGQVSPSVIDFLLGGNRMYSTIPRALVGLGSGKAMVTMSDDEFFGLSH
jgi:hypothetical protein